MKYTVIVYPNALPFVRLRLADYAELTRPRIAVALGFWRKRSEVQARWVLRASLVYLPSLLVLLLVEKVFQQLF